MYFNVNVMVKAITEFEKYTLHNKQLLSQATEHNMINIVNYNNVLNLNLNLNSIIVTRDLLLCNNVKCTHYQHKHVIYNLCRSMFLFCFVSLYSQCTEYWINPDPQIPSNNFDQLLILVFLLPLIAFL